MTHLHLAVDLSGAGAHPAAWRTLDPDQRRAAVDTLTGHVGTAVRAGFDLALLDDSFTLAPAADRAVRGTLDAVLVASRLAPVTSGIGLVATVDTTHTEPFHVAKALQTLDHVSGGRGGWQVAWSTTPAAAAAFGRKDVQDEADAVDEAREVVGVVRDLWDSWEDDAEIRDAATSRFVDRDKLHYVDHVGERFTVKGPSITPRSPQGQLPVVVRVGSPESVELAGRVADVVRIEARGVDRAAELVARVRTAAAEAGRDPQDVRVLVDLVVVLGADDGAARARRGLLDGLAGSAFAPATLQHVGDAASLVELVARWAPVVDGFTVRPASLRADLPLLADQVLPALRAAGLAAAAYPVRTGSTLRDSLGLPRPASRYAAV